MSIANYISSAGVKRLESVAYTYSAKGHAHTQHLVAYYDDLVIKCFQTISYMRQTYDLLTEGSHISSHITRRVYPSTQRDLLHLLLLYTCTAMTSWRSSSMAVPHLNCSCCSTAMSMSGFGLRRPCGANDVWVCRRGDPLDPSVVKPQGSRCLLSIALMTN